jgi:hypothetical protein
MRLRLGLTVIYTRVSMSLVIKAPQISSSLYGAIFPDIYMTIMSELPKGIPHAQFTVERRA